MDKNNWLHLAQRLNALAQNGLAYTDNFYDKERYEEIQAISMEMLANMAGISSAKMMALMPADIGYQTPKVDIRAVVLNNDGRLLMVKEKSDDNRWSLPGGWADIGYTAFEVAQKEVFEETGLVVEARRLLAVCDKRKHAHPPQPWYVYKFYILCAVTGGTLVTNTFETGDASWVNTNTLDSLSLSVDRITLAQLQLALNQAANPGLPVYCD